MPYDVNADPNQAAQADQASQEAQPLTPSTRGRFAQGFGARARTRGGLGQKAMDASRMFWEDQPHGAGGVQQAGNGQQQFGGGSAVGYQKQDVPDITPPGYKLAHYVDMMGIKHDYLQDTAHPQDMSYLNDKYMPKKDDKPATPPKDETPAAAPAATPPAAAPPPATGAGEGGTVTRPQTFIGDATQTTPPAKNIPGPNPTGQGFVGDASGSVGTKGLDTGPVYKVAGGGWDSPGFSSFTTPIKMIDPNAPAAPALPPPTPTQATGAGWGAPTPVGTQGTAPVAGSSSSGGTPTQATGAGWGTLAPATKLTPMASDVNAKEGIQPIKPIDVDGFLHSLSEKK